MKLRLIASIARTYSDGREILAECELKSGGRIYVLKPLPVVPGMGMPGVNEGYTMLWGTPDNIGFKDFATKEEAMAAYKKFREQAGK